MKSPATLPLIPVADFGKDHWSLLAYLESCVVDPADSRLTPARGGVSTLPAKTAQLNKERIRCNEQRHPFHRVNTLVQWQPSYGTRLAGYWLPDGSKAPARQIRDHDDWDALNDLEAAGFAEVVNEANAIVRITDAGITMAGRLRAHKCGGGNFANFKAA